MFLDRLVARRSPPDPLGARLEAALRARMARPGPRAAERVADIVFDAGTTGAWTLRFRSGRVTLVKGIARGASCVIASDAGTLIAILEGRLAGAEAFLEGRIRIRNNLALSLELDDLLPPTTRDPRSPRCHRVNAGGVGTFYLEAGRAQRDGTPKVVLLHGLGATGASFLPTVWDLARDHHVFSLDFPGFGESEKPLRALDAPFLARSTLAFLDALGIERAHLVGNSMGGRVALEVALRAPARVETVALLCPSMAWRRYRVAVGLVRLLRPELGLMPIPILHGLVMRVLQSMFAQPSRVPEAGLIGAADEFVRVFRTRRGRVAFFHAAREIYLDHPHGEHGFWDRLATLSVPSLFVFGTKDWLVPHAFMRHVQNALPSARCELFDDCGHVPQFEMPERTNALLREFFAEA